MNTVTELANGNNLLRIKPMEEEYIRIAESYLLPIGYLGSNLLRSNWDSGHMEGLDYNGLYEYLYRLKYQKEIDSEAYAAHRISAHNLGRACQICSI